MQRLMQCTSQLPIYQFPVDNMSDVTRVTHYQTAEPALHDVLFGTAKMSDQVKAVIIYFQFASDLYKSQGCQQHVSGMHLLVDRQ